ncbi:MAG: hypothetical protein HOI95_28870 [Chromatiales bacterium]|jgi:adenylate cyclase|nr:hypothetical protein [Chromatiales bacterium]
MDSGKTRPRLAAILAADVTRYTRLVEQDTQGTVAAWKAARDNVIRPIIAGRVGRLVKFTGDGFLAECQSVKDAVTGAMAIQQALAQASLAFRMGVHLGDVIDDGGDIHGEGVNMAARIKSLANARGINASATVHEAIRNRVQMEFEDLGEDDVKNDSAPIRIYRLCDSPTRSYDETANTTVVHLPSKPSIAVLPFDNLSNDPDQEYFADGITEDIITALSKFRWFLRDGAPLKLYRLCIPAKPISQSGASRSLL